MVDSDSNVRHTDAQATDLRGGENVYQVLANNARHRTLGELRTTAIGCGVNAAFIWWRYPGLSWLAAGFAACSAYAVWGLLDRRLLDAEDHGFVARDRADFLRKGQRIVVAAGTGVALWALMRFMAAALGGWQH
jgi:hypothetical protein